MIEELTNANAEYSDARDHRDYDRSVLWLEKAMNTLAALQTMPPLTLHAPPADLLGRRARSRPSSCRRRRRATGARRGRGPPAAAREHIEDALRMCDGADKSYAWVERRGRSAEWRKEKRVNELREETLCRQSFSRGEVQLADGNSRARRGERRALEAAARSSRSSRMRRGEDRGRAREDALVALDEAEAAFADAVEHAGKYVGESDDAKAAEKIVACGARARARRRPRHGGGRQAVQEEGVRTARRAST